MSILLVEHDMDLVMGLTDRIVVMEFGTQLMEGTPARSAGTARRCARRTWGRSIECRRLRCCSVDATCTPATAAPRCCTGSTCDAAAGSVVTVIGPNGAGKSTLLNALMGVMPRARRRCASTAQDLATRTLEERVMAGIALVPEKRELFGSMPVEDNLRRSARFRQVRWATALARRLERVYALFPRLKERRAQLAGTLSGGERQMLARRPRADVAAARC